MKSKSRGQTVQPSHRRPCRTDAHRCLQLPRSEVTRDQSILSSSCHVEGVETSLDISETARDSSTTLGMTEVLTSASTWKRSRSAFPRALPILDLVSIASASRFAFTIWWPSHARRNVNRSRRSWPKPRTFSLTEPNAGALHFLVRLQKKFPARAVWAAAPPFGSARLLINFTNLFAQD